MSQTLVLVILQCILVVICGAYPYVVVPSESQQPRHLVKRAFDRFDNNGIFSFGAKRYDRLEDYVQSNSNDNRYLFKRDIDIDDGFDFGLRRKRSFDRIGGSEFGLMKRSAKSPRDQLINNLADSIVALRHSREAEPVLISAYERRK